ncbi:tetraspanin family protein [Stylonychia lemnae]|uniref:Tetraspanin family protein n=1 Tax=Stylonychia lemnae TaxID=5949 RepID=A0A078A7R6_STYLE|nr:tetraspanin family protein [Stylonychia lemnae]|eukprot:CDW77622.1 tetraspanin family protein [Stylonychia lemnae]
MAKSMIILQIAGIAVCAFSSIVKNEAILDSNDDFPNFGLIPFYVTLSFGVILLLTGIYALFTSYKFSRVMRIILGFLSFNLFIAFIVIGSLLFSEYNRGLRIMDSQCRRVEMKEYDENPKMQNLILFTGLYDIVLMNLSNQYMCTKICPCKGVDHSNLWSEQQLNSVGRTKYQLRNQNQAITNNYVPLLFNDSRGYSNFYDCYEQELMTGDNKQTQIAPFPQSILRTIKRLENSFECNNYCEQSLFYMFKDITEGPPKSSCYTPIKQMLKRLLENGGIISIFASISLFFLLLGLICNCRYKSIKDYEYQLNQNSNREILGHSFGENKVDDSNDIGNKRQQTNESLHQKLSDIGGKNINVIEDGQDQIEYVLTNSNDSNRDSPMKSQNQKEEIDYNDSQI